MCGLLFAVGEKKNGSVFAVGEKKIDHLVVVFYWGDPFRRSRILFWVRFAIG